MNDKRVVMMLYKPATDSAATKYLHHLYQLKLVLKYLCSNIVYGKTKMYTLYILCVCLCVRVRERKREHACTYSRDSTCKNTMVCVCDAYKLT